MANKHILITKLFDAGGSNSHLKLLVKYFGEKNIILILEDKEQVTHLNNLFPANTFKTKIIPGLHQYAHLRYKFTTNIRELLNIAWSVAALLLLNIRYGFADVTISSVEPEKYLYLLWTPFITVRYILHTEPPAAFSTFTSFTCNTCLAKGKRIIAVSRHMRQVIARQWDIKPGKQSFITVIHNSLPEEQVVVKQDFLFKNHKIVLTIGRVEPNKNPATWLQVARAITANHRDVEFIWLGNGPELAHFKNLVSAEERISFKGLVLYPQPYLEKAFIYYQPSLNESHGIAVLEAMYYQLPCVVSDAGGLPESVKDDCNGYLVKPTDVQQHVSSIIKLIENPVSYYTFALNSSQRYWALFSFNNFKHGMDAVYLV